MLSAVTEPSAVTMSGNIKEALAELHSEYCQLHPFPWIVAYSGGKDSTLLLQLVFEMLLLIPRSEHTRRVYVVSNDTLVESPLLIAHLRTSLANIERAASAFDVPMSTHVTRPAERQTFWTNIIGRGYPPPNRRFRWCTDRMKIVPTTRFIREHVTSSGQVILLIGVRRAESANRAKTIDRHTVKGERLNPHTDLKGCLVFRPLVDFSTEEVWQALLQRPCPWGGRHRDLITLYRNAQAGECPLVIDRAEAPSCGSGSSRFGCWTCTVVSKDKSGEALADAGFAEYEALGEFRDWLQAFQFQKEKRQCEKRNGKVTIIDGKLLPGPFTLEAREEVLQKLLKLQQEVGRVLISEDEINMCKRIWAEDVITMVRRYLPVLSDDPEL